MSQQTLLVLERFFKRPRVWRYGYDLSRETGLKSGTLYPILMRLAEYDLLETKWVTTEDGVPARHTYRLTPTGIELARVQKPTVRSAVRIRRAVIYGSKA
jgi:PadR family transcriptional regulator, regulatory protein PadR